jgi:hypothetical protein
MLRGNLSSRPFYNERLVSAAIAALAVFAIALAAFSVYMLSTLSGRRAELKARIAQDAGRAQEIERGALALQRSVDRATLMQLAASTQEANTLIDARTFSWTVFFGLVEKTLPVDLRLVAVAPRVEKGRIRVTMTVVGRQLDDIDDFVNALQETGAFYDLLARTKERTEDDNTYRADVVAYYVPPGAAAEEPAPPARPPAGAAGKGQP